MVDCCGFAGVLSFFSFSFGSLGANHQPLSPWTQEYILLALVLLPPSLVTTTLYNVLFLGLIGFLFFLVYLYHLIWCLHFLPLAWISVHHGGHGIHGTYSRTLSWIPFCFLLNEMVLEWWLGPFFIGSVHLGSDFAGVYPFWFLCGSHHYPGGSGRSLPHSSSFKSLFLASQSLLDGGLMV